MGSIVALVGPLGLFYDFRDPFLIPSFFGYRVGSFRVGSFEVIAKPSLLFSPSGLERRTLSFPCWAGHVESTGKAMD